MGSFAHTIMIMSAFRRLFHNVPKERLTFSYVKSSGPGGQNVNKTNSKVKLKVDLTGGWLPVSHLIALKKTNGNKINSLSELLIQSDAFRSQLENEKDCRRKLQNILDEVEGLFKPTAEPSIEQKNRIEAFKKHHKQTLILEKKYKKEIKSSRVSKNNWKDKY